jgi:hypothetical protein
MAAARCSNTWVNDSWRSGGTKWMIRGWRNMHIPLKTRPGILSWCLPWSSSPGADVVRIDHSTHLAKAEKGLVVYNYVV